MKKNILSIGLFLFATTAIVNSGCKKADNTPPVITLNGGNDITSYRGDTFSDPGASASDNVDGDLTSQMNVDGTVGTAVGYYNLTYSVNDKAGNYSSKSRQVTVKYKNQYLAGTYNVVETSPFGTTNYTGSVTASTTDNTEFVFGATTAPDPIVVDADITGLSNIDILLVAQGGPLSQYTGTIGESNGHVTFTMSYLRPIGSTTTNCTATWTKQ
jgi:hypothetical protein